MRTDHPLARLSSSASITLTRPRLRNGGLILPAGLVLVAVAWTTAWAGPEPLSRYTFFPLWFGYILTVDGLNLYRGGTSYLSQSPRRFTAMFVVSMPLWWIFEALNRRLGNWSYELPVGYPPVVYAILASIAFSTVVPAMLETAMLLRSFSAPWLHPRTGRRGIQRHLLVGSLVAGVIMLGLVLLFPRQAFPLAWLSLFFVFDPINALAGRPSLIVQAAQGRWSTITSLCCAGIVCGLFWEMWNHWSMPKWTYDVPYVGFLKVFEMPILGYGGYLPFALEIFALVSTASSWVPALRHVLIDDGPGTVEPRDR